MTSVSPTLPRIEPIVPTARPQPFSDAAWLFEPEYDGFRGVLLPQPAELHPILQYSKRGNRMTRFQELAEQLRAELGRREVILDGEVVRWMRRRGSASGI